MNICVYCGDEAIHQFCNGKWCCSTTMNGCPTIKRKRAEQTKLSWQDPNRGQIKKNKVRKKRNNFLSPEEQEMIIKEFQKGASVNSLREKTGRGMTILKRLLKQSDVVYDKEKMKCNREKMERETPGLFVKNSVASNSSINRAIRLFNLIPHDQCWGCGLTEWVNGKLIFDLDHIDGDNTNNEISNLRYLCPNCHSQTKTFRGRNKNTGKLQVTDEQLIESLKKHESVREALKSVGLSPRAHNYIRANTIKSMLKTTKEFQRPT